ncbi:MAG TPA: hypothetical protein VKD72_21310 [Gemmataceae bacterium]|nr:hypothetical protein [Gemmataceae bacterium]
MTWIRTIPPAEADEDLQSRYQAARSLYPPEYCIEVPAVVDPATGTADSVVASHSLIPRVMEHAFSTYGLLLSEELPLTRRQHEMIATLVSALNRCFY